MKSKFKGPVIQRRDQVDGSTTDQRLLDSRGPSDWVHTDPWRVLRIQAEFVEGFGALAELGPAICVFGSARTPLDDPMYAKGQEIGKMGTAFGEAMAKRVGPVWGFGADQELRNMFTHTAQPGLWFIAGSFAQSRIYSKYLALQTSLLIKLEQLLARAMD